MKKYDFTKAGGMPITQETLSNMQGFTQELADALKAFFGNNNLILTGVVDTSGTLSDGVVVVAGELLRFVGGTTSTHISVQENTSQLLFADGTSKSVITERVAVPETTGTLLKLFTRVSDYKTIHDLASKISPSVSTISGTYPGDFQLTIGKSVNGIEHIDGWFTPIAEDIASSTPLVITSSTFDFSNQQFTVMAQLQEKQTHLTTNVKVNVTAFSDELTFSTQGTWPSDLENYNLYIPIHTSMEL